MKKEQMFFTWSVSSYRRLLKLKGQLLLFITNVPIIIGWHHCNSCISSCFQKVSNLGGSLSFVSSVKLFPGTTFKSLACKRASIDKIGVSGSLDDKETIHLLSDYFSHDHRVQISQRTLPFHRYIDGMYRWMTKINPKSSERRRDEDADVNKWCSLWPD